MLKLSEIVAIVELLQFGEGVPCQYAAIRCGVVCVVSTVLTVPVPLMYCVPGWMHGGGVCDVFVAAR